MDFQTAVIGVAAFIVSAGVLLLISMFGMKEKSYEEALAEQRQHANILLPTQNRPKTKENKKIKKANKKGKEKQPPVVAIEEVLQDGDVMDAPVEHSHHPKLHVEFKEPILLEEPTQEASNKQKRGRKDKVRPILIHNLVESSVINETGELAPPAINHFEQLHPKDEFELLHSHFHTKEESTVKEKPAKNGTIQEKTREKGHKVRQNSLESKENRSKQPEVIKEKRENKSEAPKEKTIKDKQVSTSPEVQKQKKVAKPLADKEEIVMEAAQLNGFPPSSVKEKKKKKSELATFQQMIGAKDGDINLSILLNVVRKAELSRSEVQILIDLLLNKQHEAPAVLDDWSEGKADPIQKLKKQLAEKEKALAEEQQALQGAQAKLREIRAEQTAEKTQMQQRTRGLEDALQSKHLELQAANNHLHTQNQKLQQMQAQINEEGLTLRKMHEENAALQLQRQQLDLHLSQIQEAETTIQDLQSRNNQLTIELHALTDQNMAAKDHQQGVMVQLQHQVNHFKNELEEKENFNRQFEELRRDLEHRLGLAHRQENEMKVELSQLNSICQQNAEEIRRLEHGQGQALDEVRNLQMQKDELEHTLSQLKSELRDAQAEKSELQLLKANGMVQENQAHKEELLNLHNELSSAQSELQHIQKKYSAELDASKNSLVLLQTELEQQKNKNNELRKRNWKVMDALKAAESKNLDTVKIPAVNADEIVMKIRLDEQHLNKKFLQRLFPDIEISDNSSYDQWAENVEKAIQRYMEELRKTSTDQQENAKLQAQIQNYKTIIENTEGILKKLQTHIENEEIQWRKKLQLKENEVETLKKQHLNELQTTVQLVEQKLAVEQKEKLRVKEAHNLLENRVKSLPDPVILEKLAEEVKRLNEELYIEQRKNEDLLKCSEIKTNDICIKEQNSNSTNGSPTEIDSK